MGGDGAMAGSMPLKIPFVAWIITVECLAIVNNAINPS